MRTLHTMSAMSIIKISYLPFDNMLNIRLILNHLLAVCNRLVSSFSMHNLRQWRWSADCYYMLNEDSHINLVTPDLEEL